MHSTVFVAGIATRRRTGIRDDGTMLGTNREQHDAYRVRPRPERKSVWKPRAKPMSLYAPIRGASHKGGSRSPVCSFGLLGRKASYLSDFQVTITWLVRHLKWRRNRDRGTPKASARHQIQAARSP